VAEQQRRGLLDNPIGDTLTAAAFMGPVGLFAGGVVKNARERRELENKLLRDQVAARQEFTDLLGRTVDVPAGPAPGPAAQPQGLWQDPAAAQPLPYSPVAGPAGVQSVPEYQTPQGQQKILQLISRMGPDGAMAAAEAVLPQTAERATAAMKEMATFGYDPTIEGFRQYNEDRGGAVDPVTALLAEMQLTRQRQAAEAEERTSRQEEEELSTEHKSFRNNLQTSGDSLMKLYEVNNRLSSREGISGFLGRPGVPFGQARRDIATQFDESVAADIDTFKSLANQIAISRLDTEGFDGNTNARFQAFTSTKPTFDAVGAANNNTILSNMNGVLLADDAAPSDAKLSPEKRATFEAFVRQLEAGGIGTRSVQLPDGRIVDNVPQNVSDQQVIQMMQGRQ
jgi:hypothetical protein